MGVWTQRLGTPGAGRKAIIGAVSFECTVLNVAAFRGT